MYAAVCALAFSMPQSTTAKLPDTPHDKARAIEICDCLDLQGPEGYWIYPDDNVTVMVMRTKDISTTSFQSYAVTVVTSEDTRLSPGDEIGRITPTPASGTYKLELFTKKSKKIFKKPKVCQAIFNETSGTLIVKPEPGDHKLRMLLNPTAFLNGFWRVVRLSVTNSSNTSEIPAGMIRLYPEPKKSPLRGPHYF